MHSEAVTQLIDRYESSLIDIKRIKILMNDDKILAWHFLPDGGNLRWGKWKNRKVRPLVTYVHKGRLELCEVGLHASVEPLDALKYAPGSIICRVQCSDRVEYGEDKLVCGRRRVLWIADATRTLHEFAIWCAEQALGLVAAPDPRSLDALRVKRLWLDGKATDAELSAAWDAASAAVSDAAMEAASAAARAAAWSARDAAMGAASAAARAAAWSARAAAWSARDAAMGAARAARDAASAAASAAAWAAAREAAWDAQNEELTRRLEGLKT